MLQINKCITEFREGEIMKQSFQLKLISTICHTAWKVSRYGVISVFSPNTGKYGPEITLYLDTFHAVSLISF